MPATGRPLTHFATFAVAAALSLATSLIHSIPEGNPQHGTRLAAATGLHLRDGAPAYLDGPSTGGLFSLLRWREVLFLASETPGGAADLYRAEVRAASSGDIFALRGLKNLTASPAGDELGLALAPPLAAVATRALGQVRSIAILDFEPPPPPRNGEWSPLTRFLARLTDLSETGRSRGIRRVTARFARPPGDVRLSFQGGNLAVSWSDADGRAHRSTVDVRAAAGDEELSVTAADRLPKRPVLWLVDTVRGLPAVGPGPIEWAEGRVFALEDRLRRLTYSAFGEAEVEEADADAHDTSEEAPRFQVAPGREVGGEAAPAGWPPPSFGPPVFERRIAGEGVWQPAVPEFVRTLPGAPPFAYRTVTRTDLERPYAKVHLFALDMRQLELHMVGGQEDPKPTTGSTGTGQIPRRADVLSRVVLAFNGAFKTEHGAYGMMVDGDVLLPPQDAAATVATLKEGRAVMGSWPLKAPIPEGIDSLRQNMDPLVENGVINPRRRYLWGFTLGADLTKMQTIRSGICMTEAGYLVYAWGEDLTASTLGKAMNAAGCVYGIHLDMNPYHTAFIYYRFADGEPRGRQPEFEAKLAIPEMMFSPYRYVNGAPKDFFFITLRDDRPGPEWSDAGLAQPAPAFLPAVFRRDAGPVQLLAVDMSRAAAHLVPGEVPEHLAPASLSGGAGTADVLASVDLGPWSAARGQLAKGAVVAALDADRASLGVSAAGGPWVGAWPPRDKNAVEDAIQADWLDRAAPAEEAALAVGFAGERWLVVGEGPRIELTAAFRAAGVTSAVAFAKAGAGPRIAVRSETGMTDLAGRPAVEVEPRRAALYIVARPRPLGMARLETAFDGSGLARADEENGPP